MCIRDRECTGKFRNAKQAQTHLDAGAGKVLISAPGGPDIDATVVFGVNEHILGPQHRIVSNASCTTNCLAPLAKVINDGIGIESGLMTTIHAYTNGQRLSDSYHKDLRRARAAGMSMIPTTTGAAKAVALVLPELDGKLDGFAVRVPTINVSMVDLTFQPAKATTVEALNALVRKHADGKILAYTDEPLVSIDFNHTSASSTFDSSMTRVIEGGLIKVCAWYDNEWGFSCRMLDTARALHKTGVA